VAFNAWAEWVNMTLGIWLLVSPWVLGFHISEALRWNSVAAGVLIAALAAWVLMQERAKADQQRAAIGTAANRYDDVSLSDLCVR